MEKLASLGTSIGEVVGPTSQIYASVLEANSANIRSTAKETHRYGDHPRQELDVYTPRNAAASAPIVLFVHGGGFVRGSKTLEAPGGGEPLVFANLGHFFAQRGYIAVAIDYRLVGVHDAVFPSGGEDVALAVKWIAQKYGGQGKRALFVLGNSAGGVHAATFVFCSRFTDVLGQVTGGTDTGTDTIAQGVRLRGVGFISTPFWFENSLPHRLPVLQAYYGDSLKERTPMGLLDSVTEEQLALLERGDVRFNVVSCEFDPEDEIIECQQPFTDLLRKKRGPGGVEVLDVAGHNHISPVLALGTSLDKDEAWGVHLTKWMDGLRT